MKNLEKKIHKYLKDRNWHNLRPSDLAKSISIESAELLELFQWENLPLAEVKKDKEKLEAISNELADVMVYAFDMAVLLGLDTRKIIHKKLTHITKKYPAHLMRKNGGSESGSGADAIYWKIKKKYRRQGK